MKTNSPLLKVGAWWDGVVDRYNRQPKAAKLAVTVLLVLFFYSLPLLRPPILTTNQIDFGGVMFSVVAFALVALGQGVAIVPHLGALHPPRDVVLSRLPLRRRTLLAHRSGAAHHPAIAAAVTALRDAAPPLPA